MSEVELGAVGVDVLVPCYQYGRFLRQCVTSALTQDVEHVRILIIDNASTDESVEVAQQLAAEDHRVEVVARRRNLGPHASYNEGIDWARSKYFIVLCADDLLTPGSLQRALSILEQHAEAGFAYGRAIWLRPEDPMLFLEGNARDASWRIIAGKDFIERFCRTAFNHISGTVLVRTATQKLAGYYRSELSHSDDVEMWMRLACLGAVAETKACQAIQRVHGSNRSTFSGQLRTVDLPQHERERMLYNWHDEAAFESFFAHEGKSLPDAARLHRLVRRSLVQRAYWAAVSRLCRGQTGAGMDLLAFALHRRPMTALFPPVGYLFGRDDGLRRVISVACAIAGRKRWPGIGEQISLDPWS
jgi:glycosyltransferase involved in cell wall biosynthesis